MQNLTMVLPARSLNMAKHIGKSKKYLQDSWVICQLSTTYKGVPSLGGGKVVGKGGGKVEGSFHKLVMPSCCENIEASNISRLPKNTLFFAIIDFCTLSVRRFFVEISIG